MKTNIYYKLHVLKELLVEITQEIIVQPIISKIEERILKSEQMVTGELQRLDGLIETLAQEVKRQNEKLGEMTQTPKEG
jgi:hypothetical protein